MNNQVICAVICITLGVIIILYVKQTPIKKPDYFKLALRGYLGGLGFIATGVMLLWEVFKK